MLDIHFLAVGVLNAVCLNRIKTTSPIIKFFFRYSSVVKKLNLPLIAGLALLTMSGGSDNPCALSNWLVLSSTLMSPKDVIIPPLLLILCGKGRSSGTNQFKQTFQLCTSFPHVFLADYAILICIQKSGQLTKFPSKKPSLCIQKIYRWVYL